MPRASNAKTHSIFLLNKEKVQENYFNGQESEVTSIIDRLMAEAPSFSEQILLENIISDPFHVRLFYHEEEKPGSKLSSFCRTFVRDDQKIISFRPRSASSVLFIWSSVHIFVITTGQGFRVVEEYCTPKFGMLVLGTYQQLFRITALDSNGMSSIVHSSKTIYANEIDFINVNSLDTIFKEVTGRLNDKAKVHSLLQLDHTSKKKSMKIKAKNSIQFSSSLDFNGLLHILTEIDQYDFSALQDCFNLISPVSPKQEADLVAANNEKVIEVMYSSVVGSSTLGFDLFNQSTNEFIEADNYSIISDDDVCLINEEDIDPTRFIKEAYSAYLNGSPSSIETFTRFIQTANLVAAKDDDTVTSGKILKHISGEIDVAGKNYYVFYGEYYYLSDSYSSRLNQSLKGKLQPALFTNTLTTVWNANEIEDDFNENASNAENYIHLHKIKPELIEFADLLKVDENGITIVHVKDGFDNDMRALDRQIELSITRVIDLKSNNNDSYLRKLYKNALACKKGKNIATVFKKEDDFIKALREKEIHYIIAIRPTNKSLLENRSNIAKHCLNALILRCFNQGIDLKINIL